MRSFQEEWIYEDSKNRVIYGYSWGLSEPACQKKTILTTMLYEKGNEAMIFKTDRGHDPVLSTSGKLLRTVDLTESFPSSTKSLYKILRTCVVKSRANDFIQTMESCHALGELTRSFFFFFNVIMLNFLDSSVWMISVSLTELNPVSKNM